MNRFLSLFNLFGVVLLSVICGIQWETNRRLQLERLAQTKTQGELVAKIEEQASQIRDTNADRDRFREQLGKASGTRKELGDELAALRNERAAWLMERNTLRSNIVAWTDAVAARDARIQEVNQALERVARERNAQTEAFNRLAEKHNATVQRLNDLLAKQNEARNPPATQRNP